MLPLSDFTPNAAWQSTMFRSAGKSLWPAVMLFAALFLSATHESLLRTELLARPLEAMHARLDCLDLSKVSGLIVLGGSQERLAEAERLARRHPNLRILVTGAGSVDEMQDFFGLDLRARLIVEARATTTRENALLTRSELRQRGHTQETWLLITSAVHMPRASLAFRQVGLEPVPWPVFDLGTTGPPLLASLREWVGLGLYYVRGWLPETPSRGWRCEKDNVATLGRLGG